MKVINLFGAPNTGKSTIASHLFSELKYLHKEVELVPEFAKVLSWTKNSVVLRDQLYIFAKQHHRIEILRDQVDFVIVDSPLLISLQHIPKDYFKSFQPLVMEVYDSFDNDLFLLSGVKRYSSKGRHHSLEQCQQMDAEAEMFLRDLDVRYTKVTEGGRDAVQLILEQILSKN